MQIGGLGTVNTLLSSVGNGEQSTTGSGFAGLIGLFMTGPEQNSSDISSAGALGNISDKDLTELLQFLETDDILDLDEGLKLLKQALSNNPSELLTIIKEAMGISKETSLTDLVQNLMSEMETGAESTEVIPSDNPVSEEQSEGKGDLEMEAILGALSQLLSLPLSDFSKIVSGDGKELIKIVKFYELLGQNQDQFGKQSDVKDLLNQLTKKLELLTNSGSEEALTVDSGKQSTRMEYLQKTFTSLAAELNGNLASAKDMGKANKKIASVQTKLDSFGGLLLTQQLSKPEQLTLTLNVGGRTTTSSELIRQFENILSRSQFSNLGGAQKLFIKLVPEHLGQLRIELIQRDSNIVAKILTTTSAAKEALESQLNGLKQAFHSQNIQVEKIEIAQQVIGQQERLFNREQQQQSQHQGQEREEQNRRTGVIDETDDFNNSFEEAILNMKV
jgi:flagellar hook-length control protein FliK